MRPTMIHILFAPPKTPEIVVTSVRMQKNGNEVKILENFEPTPYLLDLLSAVYPVEKFSSATVG